MPPDRALDGSLVIGVTARERDSDWVVFGLVRLGVGRREGVKYVNECDNSSTVAAQQAAQQAAATLLLKGENQSL